MINGITYPGQSDAIFTSEANNLNNNLGQSDFLSLLITQLQHQDPMDPMKNDEFVAQMAQFSALEQLININENMSHIRMLESSINNSQAVNLIGKNITVAGNSLQINDGTPNRVSYTLADDANEVRISVYDSEGVLVRTVTLTNTSAGKHDFEFDGLDDQGNTLSDGDYTFTINAEDADGNDVQTMSFCDVRVDGLTFDEGLVYLIAGGARFLLSDIVEVRVGEGD
jgi:flagellar basal-body rod modification protein FlgD